MRLTIHGLIAALESADVWDAQETDARPVPETIATLREYARVLTLRRRAGDGRQVVATHDAPLTPDA